MRNMRVDNLSSSYMSCRGQGSCLSSWLFSCCVRDALYNALFNGFVVLVFLDRFAKLAFACAPSCACYVPCCCTLESCMIVLLY